MNRMAFAPGNFTPQRRCNDKLQRRQRISQHVKCSLFSERNEQNGNVISSRRAFLSLTAAVALQSVFAQESLAAAKSASSAYDIQHKFQPDGFEIVASPCDQFGHQEPGSNEDICKFAKEKFGAKFLLLDKFNVNDGPTGVAPLYKFLKDTSPEGTGQRVSWNFEKFLVGPDGNVLRRYKPGILPEEIEGDVKWALKHPGAGLPPKKKPSLGVE